MKTCILKTQLLRDKRIQREIETLANANLYRFAEAIVTAYGFDFDHAFGFFSKIAERYFDSERKYELFTDMESEGIEPTGAKSVKKTKINEVWQKVGDRMMFLFDYGDNWQFVVELVGFGTEKSKEKYPRVTRSIGKAPEQYPEVDE